MLKDIIKKQGKQMKVNQIEELQGKSALAGLYISALLGIPSEQEVKQLDEINISWRSEAQALIAESFVASLVYKIFNDNPNIEDYELSEKICDIINKNLIISNKMAIDLE